MTNNNDINLGIASNVGVHFVWKSATRLADDPAYVNNINHNTKRNMQFET